MKKLLLGAAFFAVLSACSTATLINLNVDGDSFIPTASRSTSVNFTAGASVNTPIPDGGLAVPTPSLNFLTRVALKINVGVVSSTAGAITGSFELFIAPSNTANLYDPANKVPTSANCTADTAVNGVDPVNLDLNLTATSPAACATAFNRIQTGQFKIGARVSGAVTANTTLTLTINNFDVGISGYPVKILQ
jgi:hypothetical protein